MLMQNEQYNDSRLCGLTRPLLLIATAVYYIYVKPNNLTVTHILIIELALFSCRQSPVANIPISATDAS